MDDVKDAEKLETPGIIKYVVFDWGGATDWMKGKNGIFFVDPSYIERFKAEHGVT